MYEASPRESIELKLLPAIALDIEDIIAELVKILVDRPRHDAIVNGLNKYLEIESASWPTSKCYIPPYPAAIVVPSHLMCFRGEAYNFETTDSPELDMRPRALAFMRSRTIYTRLVRSW